MAATRRPRVDGFERAGMGRQIGRHGFGGRRQGRDGPGVAPRFEQAKVRPVGLARAGGLLCLCQVDCRGKVRAKGGREIVRKNCQGR